MLFGLSHVEKYLPLGRFPAPLEVQTHRYFMQSKTKAVRLQAIEIVPMISSRGFGSGQHGLSNTSRPDDATVGELGSGSLSTVPGRGSSPTFPR